ncbi:DUF6221 family protein [Streptomyces sp. NPDC020298]|uniref:DUF6221 family protein n=1 Tax=unclassified Streptomyces TaxID=2593676 RepID=UPI00340737EF
MDELVRWLGEQLDEDERIARAAGGRSEQEWAADLSGKDPAGMSSWPVVVRYVTDGRLRGAVANLPVMQERSEDRMVHIAAHDPARVLREIDARRAIVDDLAEEIRWGARKGLDYQAGVAACERTLKRLALPYADRPGFREEWRP